MVCHLCSELGTKTAMAAKQTPAMRMPFSTALRFRLDLLLPNSQFDFTLLRLIFQRILTEN